TRGGSSRLIVDLAGLGTTGIAQGVVLYGGRAGNVPVFTEVDVDNNPNNFAVGLGYAAGGLNLIIATGVNDTPVNTVPGPQATIEDTPLVFSTANGNRIAVSDGDAGNNPVKVTLSVTHGTLPLSGTNGLTFSAGDGSADATMTFTGAIPDVNAALDGLSDAPDAAFSGLASLTITTDDQGNFGVGGPRSATSGVSVT